MVFSSLSFLFFFLPVALILYYVTPQRFKYLTLLFLSLWLFAWGSLWALAAVGLVIAVDYGAGLLMGHTKRAGLRVACLGLAVAFHVALLVLMEHGMPLFYATQEAEAPSLFSFPGLLFIILRGLSYLIDVFSKRVPAEKNPLQVACYITLFPCALGGPVVRYSVYKISAGQPSFSLARFGGGAGHFVRGLAKKVFLANNIVMLWYGIVEQPLSDLSVLGAWIGILAFAFSVYFTLSGYADMAVGLGRMLGYSFPSNFDYPATAANLRDFFRRWMTTVTQWFRQYVYIPLGGSHSGRLRRVCNLLVVWALFGLWHGFHWNTLVWGLSIGVFLSLETMLWRRWLSRLPKWIPRAYTIVIVLVGFAIFAYPSLPDGLQYIGAMFGATGIFADSQALFLLTTHPLLLLLCLAACTRYPGKLAKWAFEKAPWLGNVAPPLWEMLCLVLSVIFMLNTQPVALLPFGI